MINLSKIVALDKALHFLVCMVVALACQPIFGWWALLIASGAGFAKELRDWIKYGGFSWGDILWDHLGIIAAGIIILINRLIKIILLS